MNHFRFILLIAFLSSIYFVSEGQGLIINEVMSSNQQFLRDEDGDTPDWIELWNSSDAPINLMDYSISKIKDADQSWVLPDQTLHPGEYLILFASGKDVVNPSIYWNTIINEGDVWQYILPNVEPDSNWKDPDFNASSWETGQSGIGYGDDDDNTIITPSTSVFMRRNFSISNKDSLQTALFHMDYDDGYVAYINDVEFARRNMSSVGAPPFDAFAANSSHEAVMFSGGIPEEIKLDNIADLLINGTNTLAIQVHNAGINSTDLSAIPFLTLGHKNKVQGSVVDFINIPTQRWHTDFKISSNGASIYLFNKFILTDSVQLGSLPSNISLGRIESDASTWFYFDQATPGNPNTTPAYTSFTGDVEFSIKGGIYTDEVKIELSSKVPTDKIYFTTDGTEPENDDHLYAFPISISNTTQVRARIINPGAMTGFVASQSYLFNIAHDLPIISLITEPDNFFDYNTGIYVTGPNAASAMPHYGANYWQEWEKPIHVSMINTNGTLAFEQNAGVKIFGGWTRAHAQKSLSLRFRKKYGTDGLDYKVFSDLELDKFYSLNLRNSGNDWNNTMLWDGVLMQLFPKRIASMAFQPSVVYLNGEYWGIHNIRERMDKYYLQEHYGVDADKVNIMEFHADNFLQLVDGDDQHYLDLLDFLRNNDISLPANYNYVKTQMNVENFATYMACNIYLDNTDWPGNNIKFWRSDDEDSKWEWLAYDTDFGFKNVSNNTLTFAMADNRTTHPNPAEATLVLRRLNENEDFRHFFINVFADQLNTQWLPSEVDLVVDEKKNTILNEIPSHFERWEGYAGNWANRVNNLKSFGAERPDILRSYIQNYYSLSGKYTLRLTLNENSRGSIELNTLHPQSYPWYGFYFKDVPIKLRAIPNKGYKFVAWEGASTSTNASITLDANRNSWVKAIFEVDESYVEKAVVINEVNYKRAIPISSDDWVELTNRSNKSVDISGWVIKDDNDAHAFVIPATTVLKPDSFLLICKDLLSYQSYYGNTESCIGDLGFGFSDVSDCVRLYNENAMLIDSVSYTNPDLSVITAFSFQRAEHTDNWRIFDGDGTPNAPNEFAPDKIKTELSEPVLVKVFPNPFKNTMNIIFDLKHEGEVTIQLLSNSGRVIENISNESFSKGTHAITWHSKQHLSQGIYILVIKTNAYITTKKVIRF